MEDLVREVWGPASRMVSWAGKDGDEEGQGYQFASELVSGKLTLEIPMIVKKQPPDQGRRMLMNSDSQFHNEVYTYRELLPRIGAAHMMPRMFLGRATLGRAPETDIVALEFLEEYRPFKIPFLEVEYLKAALESLGEFHSCSYRNKGEVSRLAGNLRKCGISVGPIDMMKNVMDASLMRGIQPVLDSEKGKYPELRELVGCFDDFKLLATYLESGEEPTAVLCHGDFCSNNILFSKGVAVKFVDLQKASYASPAMDLSFFLYLNTSPETRELHWDALLDSYLGKLDSECSPSRDLILKEFAKRAFYGYLHVSFFLAQMVSPGECPALEVFLTFSEEEKIRRSKEMGGPKVTDLLAAVIRHQCERGYIKAVVEGFNEFRRNN